MSELSIPESIAIVFVIAFTVIMMLGWMALYIASVVWSYRDAEERGQVGCMIALVVAFIYWPLGLILWVLFRPDHRRRQPY